MIEGQNAWAAGDNDKKANRPNALLRPGIRIDENPDDSRHAQKGKGREPAGETDDEQDRKEMLAEGGDIRSECGIDQRQPVFVPEQRDRIVRHMPAFNLGLTRSPEDGGRKNPRPEGNKGLWNLIEECRESKQRPCGARWLGRARYRDASHVGGTSIGSSLISIARPAKRAARLAARSKFVLAVSAKAAAAPSGSPAARPCKKTLAPGGSRRISTPVWGRTTSASSPCQSLTGASSIAPEFIAQIVTMG